MEEIKVGMGLYLKQEGRSYGCSAMVKHPYFVEYVSDSEVIISEAHLEWGDERYFDSMPINIVRNPNAKKIVLHFSKKMNVWWAYKDSTSRDYPMVAHFGRAEYYPYLD